MSTGLFDNADLVYSYPAAQAVEDGVLIPVDARIAKEAGYNWPVRLSKAVHEMLAPDEAATIRGESYQGRLWDVLWMARWEIAAQRGKDTDTCQFQVKIGRQVQTLWACIDTTSGPAVHIITPDEY